MAKNNRSFNDMFDKYRLMLNLKYLDHIFTSEAVHRDFYEKIQHVRLTGGSESDFVRDYFHAHSQDINREAYIFFTYKTLKEEVGLMRYPEVVENCRKALRNSKYVYYEPKLSNDGNDVEIERISARGLIGMEEERDTEKRLAAWREATKSVTPISFFSYSSNTEIGKYCQNEDLSSLIVRLNFIRVVETNRPLSIEEKLKFLKGENNERLEELTREAAEKLNIDSIELTNFYSAIPEYVERYPEEFDLDKIFLISAYKASEFLEGADLSVDENEKYTVLFKTCMEAIRKRGTKVDDLYSFLQNPNRRNVSYRELEPLLGRITSDGHYLSKAEEQKVLDRISVEGGRLVALMEEDPEILKMLHLSDDDYEEMLTEQGILAFITLTNLASKRLVQKKYKSMEIPEFDMEILVKANYFTPEEVLDYCSKKETIGPDLFTVLNEEHIIDAKTKIDYFVDGKIEYELLDRLTDEEKEEIKEALSAEELIDLYFHKDEDEEKENKYNRYLRLYRDFKLRTLEREDRLLADEEILEALGDNLEDEILKDLYKRRIITFRTLRDWSGTNLIASMMENTEIRPEDVRELCTDGEFDALFAVLGNPNIPKSRKMAIFRTSFANIEYEELDEEAKDNLYLARDEALRLINLKDEKSSARGQGNGVRRGRGQGKRFNEYTSDPQLRWDLIDLMGDYSYEMLDQGTAIFEFPDYRGGTIIIEKMYKKDKPEYGRATKVISMPIEDFERIKSDLIVNDDIPVYMIDSHPALQGRVRNITHTTAWGQQLADYFEYDLGDVRTPEEIERIDRKIQSINNSRELR